MEVLNDTQFSIPALQIVLMLLFSSFALLYGRTKLALLINYFFALHWGYFSNSEMLFRAIENIEVFTLMYYGIGVGAALLVVLVFLFDTSS